MILYIPLKLSKFLRASFVCIVKPPVLLGVEKLIAMDKNLLAHYNKSRFADRN